LTLTKKKKEPEEASFNKQGHCLQNLNSKLVADVCLFYCLVKNNLGCIWKSLLTYNFYEFILWYK